MAEDRPLTIHKAPDTPAADPVIQQGGRNWLRMCQLIVGDDAGSNALDLSGLRVRFETISATSQALGQANVIISNVSRQTYVKVQSEFTRITLLCGYERGARPGIIFSGTITECEYGEKENWTDPLLKIWAQDGDTAYNGGHVNKTLSSGWSPKEKVDVALEAWKPFGITLGDVLGVDLTQPRFPRGAPLAGMARNLIREVAGTKYATWNLRGGKLNIVHKDHPGTGGPILLSGTTGMIGQPIQTVLGIKVRCLINSAITVDIRIKIDQRSIIKHDVLNSTVDASGSVTDTQTELATQGAADGVYRVLEVRTEGDSRGPPWYMDLTCVGAFSGDVSKTQADMGWS